MVIGSWILGTKFVQMVLLLVGNYLLCYKGEFLMLLILEKVFQWCLILGMFLAPLYLAIMKCVRPLYIIPSLPLSFRALQSCSPIHLKYAFF